MSLTKFGIATGLQAVQHWFMNDLFRLLGSFLKNEQGQDLIEYTLLMAFVALASAALFVNAGGSISGIWGSANTQLSTANSEAS